MKDTGYKEGKGYDVLLAVGENESIFKADKSLLHPGTVALRQMRDTHPAEA